MTEWNTERLGATDKTFVWHRFTTVLLTAAIEAIHDSILEICERR
jgi:hypothetical protein